MAKATKAAPAKKAAPKKAAARVIDQVKEVAPAKKVVTHSLEAHIQGIKDSLEGAVDPKILNKHLHIAKAAIWQQVQNKQIVTALDGETVKKVIDRVLFNK